MEQCSFCETIDRTKRSVNPFAVAQTRRSLIVLGWHQFYAGHTLVISKQHVLNSHELGEWHRRNFIDDLELVREAVLQAFEPSGVEIRSSKEENKIHLYRQYFPRRRDQPPWIEVPSHELCSNSTVPDKQRLQDLRAVLSAKLAQVFHGRDDFRLCLTQQSIYPPHLT